MYLYKFPSEENETLLKPLKLLGTSSNFFPLAESCTLNEGTTELTTSGLDSDLTSGFGSGFFASGAFTVTFFGTESTIFTGSIC